MLSRLALAMSEPHHAVSCTPSFVDHPYAAFLHEVEKPARYVGGEYGETRKDWDAATYRICLAFPDLYDIGMSHLGTRILYRVLNDQADALCERAFAPWLDMEAQLRKRALPIVSLENARPLRDFDVIGISLQHELAFTNVLTLLDLGGIALRSESRADSDPLVLGGGSVATHPEALAPFFDAFVVGDGERKAFEVLKCWTDARNEGVDRQTRLRRLAELGGVYVPSLYETRYDEVSRRVVVDKPRVAEAPLPVRRAFVEDIDIFPFPDHFPVGGPEAVFERLSIELTRGCMQGCRFCQAGMIFRPERERDPAGVVSTILSALSKSGQDEVALTALSTADYSHIEPLVHEVTRRLKDQSVALGVSSLRAYGLTDGILNDIRSVRATGLTFAPEAGTQRLRDVINKNITEEQLLETTERVLTRGWDRLKLYFMIGLPTETEQDVAGIVETAVRAREAGRRARGKGRKANVTASVSTFVPKPHTPFQWVQMDGAEAIASKQADLRTLARSRDLDLKTHEMNGTLVEGLLARADRRVADVVENAWRSGARFDAWDGYVHLDMWMAALDKAGLSLDDYLSELPVDGPLPWSHIHVGIEPSFLQKEYEKSLRARTTHPCGRPALPKPEDAAEDAPDNRKLVCFQCGAGCDLDEIKTNRQEGLVNLRRREAEPLPQDRPEKPAQPFRYRFRFHKLGRAAMLGHLDLVREMPRILRRAKVSLWSSQGFHPKPVMTFGPALALGIPSFDEILDIKTAAVLDEDTIVERLNEVCPTGLGFEGVRPLVPGESAVGAGVTGARYLVGIDSSAVQGVGGIEGLAQRVRDFMAKESVVVPRSTKKGGDETIDLRPQVLELSVGDGQDESLMRRAGVPGAYAFLRVETKLLQSGPVRMREVVEGLIGDGTIPIRVVRVRLIGAE